MIPPRLLSGIAVVVVAALMPVAAAATPGPTWTEVKCARYRAAWTEYLARRGRNGLSDDFVARHEAFIAGGCTAPADVCPRSPTEFEAANILTVLAMNAGTASTFLPFACPR